MEKMMQKKIMALLMLLVIVVILLPALKTQVKAGDDQLINCINGSTYSLNTQAFFNTPLTSNHTIGFTFLGDNPGLYFEGYTDAVASTSLDTLAGYFVTDDYENIGDLVFRSTTDGPFVVTVRIDDYYDTGENVETTTLTFMTTSANTSPTVTTPIPISYTDTYNNDLFSYTNGTISATDSDGTISSYGIFGGTTGGSTIIGGVTYDVSKTGTYGTLYVKSETGAYTFDPNDEVINAVFENQSETFTVTATDNIGATGNATLKVNITGVNDAPTLTAMWAMPTYTENGSAVTLYSGTVVNTIELGQTISEFMLTVSNLVDGASEILNIDGTDVALTNGNSVTTSNSMSCNVSVTGSTATITLSKDGGISVASMQNLVNGIKYRNSSENPTTGFRYITLIYIKDNGGTANFGTDIALLSISSTVTVTAINDAPVLDSTGSMTLTSTTEDSTDPVGSIVKNIIASAGGDRIIDVDSGAVEGIAVTTLTGVGDWQYNIGSGWVNISPVSTMNALLLSDTALIRFIPTAEYNNSQIATLTFRAWDRTSGTQGTKADVSTNGGTTAFSTSTETASVEVTAVNDNPTITGKPEIVTVTEKTTSNLDLSAATFSDPDSGTNSITLTLSVDLGTLSANTGIAGVTVGGSETVLNLSGTVNAIDTYLNNASNIKYTGPVGTFGNSSAILTITANDGGNSGEGGGDNVSLGTVNINIIPISPTVTNVTSTKINGTYGLGETIEITVQFSHAVVITGTPQLTLETGVIDRTANYTSGSGSDTLTFTYITQAGDETADLNYTDSTALSLNSGTIKRGETSADLTLPATTEVGSLGKNKSIVIEAYPTVTLCVSSANVEEDGGTSTITAKLSTISSQDVVINIAYSGTATSGTDYNATASTTITIPAGNLSASAVTGISAIQDTVTEDNETIIIDIISVSKGVEDGEQQATITILDDDIPTVINVSSTTANGYYKAGDTIAVTVTFSAPVIVTGTPLLLLETGITDRMINYMTGSETTSLTFYYTVQAGDASLDLDYKDTSSLTLNGGSIASSGILANLVLPIPGATGSLGANKAIVVDTTTPAAPSTPDMTAGTDSGTSNTDNITKDITPTFAGTAEASSTITLYDTDGTTVIGTGNTDISGNWTITTSALSSGAHIITAKSTDMAGNVSVNSSGLSVIIDTTTPNAPSTPDMTAGTDSGTSNTDNITNDTTPTFVGTAEVMSTVTLYDTDGTTVIGTGNVDINGNWTITTSTPLSGIHIITTKSTDIAGNVSVNSSGLSITIDTTAPNAPSTPVITTESDTGTSNTDNITNNTTPTFTGTAEANSMVTIYSSIDGSCGTITADASGNWSITTSDLSPGTHNISATAADVSGNLSSVSSGLSLDIDTTKPIVSSINRQDPTNESINATSVIYRITFSENISGLDIADFTLTKTGTVEGTIDSVSASSGTTIDITVNSITGDGTLRLDLNSSSTDVQDVAGNAIDVGYISGQTYEFDFTVPSVNITSVVPSNTNTSPIPVTITFSESVTGFTVDDITVGNGMVGNFTAIDGTTYTADITPDAQGEVTVDVEADVAQDSVGNNNSVATQLSIVYDTTAPTVGAGGSIVTSEFASSSIKLTWTAATDNIATTANLQYKILYSTSNNISALSDAETNGTTFRDWRANITSITVTGLASNKEYYFNVLVKDESGNKTVYTAAAAKTSAAPVYDDTPNTPTTPPTSAVVEVNGEKQDAGQASTQIIDGQTLTTITVDDTKLNNILEQKGNNATVTLPASGTPDVVVGQLNGQTIKNMEEKDATLVIKTETITYTLPASQFNIDTVSSQFGSHVNLNDIKVNIKVAESPTETIKIVEDTANKGNYQLIVKPVEFEITCTSGNKTVEVSRFNGYVERTIAIPDGVDPSKITTGIVLNADGTFRHVPTQIIVIDGRYYAKIYSLTNSTYSVVYNPVMFSDVSRHWAKDAINDMGSRMVVSGIGNSTYEPERNITRAEFAAIIVRALGLAQGTTESAFGDVSLTDWFNGYVETATSYSLISGYNSTSYAPNDMITREQAMTILTRAMKLTGLRVSFTDSEVKELLGNYMDADLVSDYAKIGVATCIKTGIVKGTTATTISPKDYVTRAEVAVMVQRLLQKSGLI